MTQRSQGQSNFAIPKSLRSIRSPFCFVMLSLIVFASLACSLIETRPQAISQGVSLPDATRTAFPTFTPTALPTFTPRPTFTPTVPPVQPTETPPPPSAAEVSISKAAIPETATSSATAMIEPVESDPVVSAPVSEPPASAPAAGLTPTPVSVVAQAPTATATALAPNSPAPVNTATAAPTATPSPTSVPTQISTNTPVPVPTDTATALPTATPTATPESLSTTPGWLFSGVRLDQRDNSLLLFGNLINQTNAPQQLEFISGVFYDDQGQVIAAEDSTFDYWPLLDTIPVGGHIPFEVLVDGIQSAARFGLNVQADQNGDAPHQNFAFSDVQQFTEDGAYCLSGIVNNQGNSIEEYLVLAAILYNNQDQVINFGEGDILDDEEAMTFAICVDPPNQDVARYELLAWGH